MRLVLTKSTITQIVDELRNLTDCVVFDSETQQRYTDFAEREFDTLSESDRAECVDHLLGIASYSAALARELLDRERA